MKVEHISSNLFSVELSPTEFKHVLELSNHSKSRMVEFVTLWFEIGIYTSTAIEKGLNEKCEPVKFPKISTS